jgi:hypothetical protein
VRLPKTRTLLTTQCARVVLRDRQSNFQSWIASNCFICSVPRDKFQSLGGRSSKLSPLSSFFHRSSCGSESSNHVRAASVQCLRATSAVSTTSGTTCTSLPSSSTSATPSSDNERPRKGRES